MVGAATRLTQAGSEALPQRWQTMRRSRRKSWQNGNRRRTAAPAAAGKGSGGDLMDTCDLTEDDDSWRFRRSRDGRRIKIRSRGPHQHARASEFHRPAQSADRSRFVSLCQPHHTARGVRRVNGIGDARITQLWSASIRAAGHESASSQSLTKLDLTMIARALPNCRHDCRRWSNSAALDHRVTGRDRVSSLKVLDLAECESLTALPHDRRAQSADGTQLGRVLESHRAPARDRNNAQLAHRRLGTAALIKLRALRGIGATQGQCQPPELAERGH